MGGNTNNFMFYVFIEAENKNRNTDLPHITTLITNY